MNTKFPVCAVATLAILLGSSALAQDSHGMHGSDSQEHHGMDHAAHDHGDHAMAEDAADSAEANASLDAAEGRTVTVQVDGMVCDFCARSLIKVMKKKDSVEDVAIDLTAKTVTLRLADGASLSDEEIEKAVKSAGYSLAGIERS